MKEVDAKLMAASWNGCDIAVKDLLADGASVHAVTTLSNKTALFYAARRIESFEDKETALQTSRRVDVVDTLVKAGADVNFRSGYSLPTGVSASTPLIDAASGYNASGSDVVEALLRCGADVNLQRSDGSTALMHAINRHEDYSYRFIEHFDKYSKLIVDTRPPTTDIEEALLKAGADVNLEDRRGSTALLKAARFYSINGTGMRVVQALLTAGAEVRTALHEAAMNFDKEAGILIMETLLKAGVDVDRQDPHGRTAVMIASEHGSLKMVRFLVETAGANTAIKDNFGRTAGDVASSEAVATYLHEHPPSFFQKFAVVWHDTVNFVWQEHRSVSLVIFVCVLVCAVWTIAINHRHGERVSDDALIESKPAPE